MPCNFSLKSYLSDFKSNERTARSFDFEITRMISAEIALHSVQLPLRNTYIVMPIEVEHW